jgi:hypothetical protein
MLNRTNLCNQLSGNLPLIDRPTNKDNKLNKIATGQNIQISKALNQAFRHLRKLKAQILKQKKKILLKSS